MENTFILRVNLITLDPNKKNYAKTSHAIGSEFILFYHGQGVSNTLSF